MKVGIIGAGIIGASIAYQLSQLSVEVTLWESGDRIGGGASGSALGVLMAVGSGKTSGDVLELRLASLSKFDPLMDGLFQAGITVPYHRSGIVYLSKNSKTLSKWQKLVRVRAEQGFSLEFLENFGDWQSDGALVSPLDRWVHPPQLLQALMQVAQSRGARVITGTKITPQDLPILSKELDWLVLTTGLGTNQLLDQEMLQPVRGVAMTVDLPSLHLDRVLHLENSSGEDINLVPIGGDHYWIGATVNFELRGWSQEQDVEWLFQEIQTFHSGFGNGQIVHSWHGDRPRPRSARAPIIGFHSDLPKVLIATGHYRNGVLLSQATAQIIQDLILEGDSPLPWRAFSRLG